MEYLITAIFIAISFFAIYRIRMYAAKGISKHWFAAAFGLKLIVALAMILLYSRSEKVKDNADIFRFYDDAKVIYNTLYSDPSSYFKLMFTNDFQDPSLANYIEQLHNIDSPNSHLFNSNGFIIKYLAFLSIFTFGYYGAMVVLAVFLSFTGLFWIFRFFNSKLKNLKWLIFAVLFFTPSILFWTSGILKESLLIFAIGLLLNCGNFALKGRKPIMRLVMVLIALLLIFALKAFVFLVLIPPILAYLWVHYLPSQRKIIPYFIMLFIGFSFASESSKILDKGVFDILVNKQLAMIELAIQEGAGSTISPIMFEANSLSVATNSPIAVINTLFRPMPWEANGITMYMASMENIALLLLTILVVLFPRKKIENINILLFSLIFAFSYFVIIGLATPVLGTLSRYRVPGLIFYLMLLLQVLDLERLWGVFGKGKSNESTPKTNKIKNVSIGDIFIFFN